MSARTQAPSVKRKRGPSARSRKTTAANPSLWMPFAIALVLITAGVLFHQRYTLSFQSPVRLNLHSPFVVAERTISKDATAAEADQKGSTYDSGPSPKLRTMSARSASQAAGSRTSGRVTKPSRSNSAGAMQVWRNACACWVSTR